MSDSHTLVTAGGRILCPRCQAKAKRTGQQCRRPATKGKKVCKLHGGLSTGPRTQAGRERCARARLVHGRETTAIREERSLSSARLAVLEWAGHTLGFMEGRRTRGPKPQRMDEVELELQDAMRRILLRSSNPRPPA
jgi:hypothetical protein